MGRVGSRNRFLDLELRGIGSPCLVLVHLPLLLVVSELATEIEFRDIRVVQTTVLFDDVFYIFGVPIVLKVYHDRGIVGVSGESSSPHSVQNAVGRTWIYKLELKWKIEAFYSR
jgi:hypothetical protein